MPVTRTRKEILYKFEELSEKAQERALCDEANALYELGWISEEIGDDLELMLDEDGWEFTGEKGFYGHVFWDTDRSFYTVWQGHISGDRAWQKAREIVKPDEEYRIRWPQGWWVKPEEQQTLRFQGRWVIQVLGAMKRHGLYLTLGTKTQYTGGGGQTMSMYTEEADYPYNPTEKQQQALAVLDAVWEDYVGDLSHKLLQQARAIEDDRTSRETIVEGFTEEETLFYASGKVAGHAEPTDTPVPEDTEDDAA